MLFVAAAPGGVITGRVVDTGDSTPVVGVNVTIPGTELGAATDSAGRFTITDTNCRDIELLVSHVAYEPVRMALAATDGVRRIDFRLRPRPILLEPVEIRAPAVSVPSPSTIRLTANEILSLPGAEKDLFRALQTLPGVASTGDYFGWLYVRGGTPTENLFLLDGLEIPNPYHFSGLASVFNTNLVDNVSFSTGGFGPTYGDCVSSVLDVTTRLAPADRVRLHAGLDMTELDGTVELKLPGRTEVAAALRHSYLDEVLRRLDFGAGYILPTYTDFQARAAHRFSRRLSLSATVLGSSETALAGDSGHWRRPDLSIISNLWTAGADLEWHPGDNATVRCRVSALDSRQEMAITDALGTNRRDHHPRKLTLSGNALVRPSTRLNLEAGASVSGIDYFHRSTLPMELLDPTRWGDTVAAEVATWQCVGFVRTDVEVLKHLRLGAGLRLDYRELDQRASSPFLQGTLLSPRLNARYSLGERTTLRGAWGLYRQFVAPELLNPDSPDPDQPEPLLSRHAIIGIEHRFAERVSAGLELYDKTFDNIVVVRDNAFTDVGIGWARGVEFTLRQQLSDRLFWWASYSFSLARRSWLHGAEPVPTDGEQPHILNLAGSAALPGQFDLGAKLRLASGAPYTPEAFYYENHCIPAEHNSARYPAYFRLDLRIARGFRIGAGRLTCHVSVLNVTGVHNVQSYYYDENGEQRTIYMTPRLPFLGLEYGL